MYHILEPQSKLSYQKLDINFLEKDRSELISAVALQGVHK